MTALDTALQAIGRLFIWWVVIAPWERGILVRLGKRARVLNPGIHLRIPGLDRVYRQPIRSRTVDCGSQTVMTSDGHPLSIAASILYAVADIALVFETLSEPEGTLADLTRAELAKWITAHAIRECAPDQIAAGVLSHLKLARYGLDGGDVLITDWTTCRTYRLINDRSMERWSERNSRLNTNREHGKQEP